MREKVWAIFDGKLKFNRRWFTQFYKPNFERISSFKQIEDTNPFLYVLPEIIKNIDKGITQFIEFDMSLTRKNKQKQRKLKTEKKKLVPIS